jgi:hypothetical protein
MVVVEVVVVAVAVAEVAQTLLVVLEVPVVQTLEVV